MIHFNEENCKLLLIKYFETVFIKQKSFVFLLNTFYSIGTRYFFSHGPRMYSAGPCVSIVYSELARLASIVKDITVL